MTARKPTGLSLRRDATPAEKKAYRATYQKVRRADIRAQRREYYKRRPEVFKRGAAKWEAANRPAINARHKAYSHAHPEKALWISAKSRAKKLGVPFAISESDIVIPKRCPALDLELKVGAGRMHPNSPTLDRLVPARGYVPGNIAVISWRANCIKHNATFLEVVLLARWLERTL